METWSYDKTPLANTKSIIFFKTKEGKILAEVERKDGTQETLISK